MKLELRLVDLQLGGRADLKKLFQVPAGERAANMQTRLYTVTLSLPSDTDGLLAGMFADVTFHTDVSENTIVVPTAPGPRTPGPRPSSAPPRQ
mgnify:CR=1 FL=1